MERPNATNDRLARMVTPIGLVGGVFTVAVTSLPVLDTRWQSLGAKDSGPGFVVWHRLLPVEAARGQPEWEPDYERGERRRPDRPAETRIGDDVDDAGQDGRPDEPFAAHEVLRSHAGRDVDEEPAGGRSHDADEEARQVGQLRLQRLVRPDRGVPRERERRHEVEQARRPRPVELAGDPECQDSRDRAQE